MPQPLYRGLDRGEIDRQFNLRARWPEHIAFFARWAADSAAARQRLGGHVDLAYGESPGETVDLFLPSPAPAAPPPLLAFIHGGYWQSLDKSDFSYLAPTFLQAGIAFASINYDLAPKVSIGQMVAQVCRCVLWLARAGHTYGFDGGRLFLVGHSAGGHLGIMALLAGKAAAVSEPVKGVCSISGIYELEPLRHSYQQEVLRLDAASVRALSPLRYVPSHARPVILAVGSEETEEFLRQQAELAAAWRAAGVPVDVVDLPGRHHFSAVDALGEVDHPLFAAVSAMVRRTV